MNSFFPDMNKGLNANTNDVVMSYSQNDFFWQKAGQQDCSHLTDDHCTSIHDDNKDACIKKALCKNKEQSQILMDLEAKNYGVDRKYDDDQRLYYNTLLNTANLGIGIVVLVGLIYKMVFPS
jgi:hypothetical protein